MNLVRRIVPKHIRKLTENELCHRILFQVPALRYRQQLPGNLIGRVSYGTDRLLQILARGRPVGPHLTRGERNQKNCARLLSH